MMWKLWFGLAIWAARRLKADVYYNRNERDQTFDLVIAIPCEWNPDVADAQARERAA